MIVFIMYIMCFIIFEEKAEIQDQYPSSLNPVQKADDPESGHYPCGFERTIELKAWYFFIESGKMLHLFHERTNVESFFLLYKIF